MNALYARPIVTQPAVNVVIWSLGHLVMAAKAFLLFTALAVTAFPSAASAQDFTIGVIDLYGLRQVPAADIRRVLTFKEGDAVGDGLPGYLAESERRIAALPGVAGATATVICCDGPGRVVVFVGVEENGGTTVTHRPAPTGTVRLPPDVVAAGEAFDAAFQVALQGNDFAEDDTQGHALFHAPGVRAVQERFVALADRNLAPLRDVLRNSSDAQQRALAVMILGYVKNKPAVVDDLVAAMNDPDDQVRNNAMRTLAVFAKMTTAPPPRIPYQPFIRLLTSPIWFDRNKASGALDELSIARDATLLRLLQQDALHSLVEMARWKSKGHAQAAFMILGRIAGLPEAAILDAFQRDDRAAVIDAATR